MWVRESPAGDGNEGLYLILSVFTADLKVGNIFKKSVTKKHILCEEPRVVKFIETVSRMEFPGVGEEGRMKNYCLMDTEFEFFKMKKS